MLCRVSATTGYVPQKQRWHGEAPSLRFGSAPTWQRDEVAHPPREAVLLFPSQRPQALPAAAVTVRVTIQASKSDLKQSKMQTASRLLWEPPGTAGSSRAPRWGWVSPPAFPLPCIVSGGVLQKARTHVHLSPPQLSLQPRFLPDLPWKEELTSKNRGNEPVHMERTMAM